MIPELYIYHPKLKSIILRSNKSTELAPGPKGIIEEEEKKEVFVFVDVGEVLGIAGTKVRAHV